jgi:hypothetical protein
MMLQSETHPMIMVASHPSRLIEWLCPSCGCHVLVSWPPEFHRIILNPGDRSAAHISCKDDRSIDAADLPSPSAAEARLVPWLDWMEKSNFERLWT